MATRMLLVPCVFWFLTFSLASAAIVEHSFFVQQILVQRLCRQRMITAVNGGLPGPTIDVQEGDTLVVRVFNMSPYNLTIHWHGIFQLFSAWADGPSHITQCPIRPGGSYTYRFTVTDQEGTLWWHVHTGWLRATVYGALLIRPRLGQFYPFPRPQREVPILLGEWWNANVNDVESQALATGGAPNLSDAFTINGQPGDLYPCSSGQTYRLTVIRGETYLLRIINAALNSQLFFKIANHKMTVVAVDASYTTPMITDVVVVSPGQTTDVLLTADQPPASYYMAARAYASSPGVPFDNTTTTGIISYLGAPPVSTPIMPLLPDFDDTPTAHKFFSNLTGLTSGAYWVPVPLHVDEPMFMTINLGLVQCGGLENATCAGPFGQRLAASINNVSFEFPSSLSLLEAFFSNVPGIYALDFPSQPPLVFDYTNLNNSFDLSLIVTSRATKVKRLRFNSTVEIVMQNTALIGVENHPIHLHGFNFHVLAQGFRNFDPVNDPKKYNLVNPHMRNTVAVPVGGWAVVRFQANNPGTWIMHCHLDAHMSWGLAMAFAVDNGPTPSTSLPPPPSDLPQC